MNTTTTDYQLRRNPWVILMHTELKPIAVGRHRKRNDAEEHLKLLKRQILNSKFEVVYSPNE